MLLDCGSAGTLISDKLPHIDDKEGFNFSFNFTLCDRNFRSLNYNYLEIITLQKSFAILSKRFANLL